MARYLSFVPQPSRADVIRQLVELAVSYAAPQVIYETSIEIQGLLLLLLPPQKRNVGQL